MIHIKSLKKKFGNLSVFENIDLHIKEGEFVSLLGPSGCGKTTLINIIAGLDEADEGSILMNDEKIHGTSTDRIMVFQNAALFPWLNVFDNVSFGLKNICKDQQDIRIKVEDVLRKVHLYKFRNHFPHELSGGMKQRVSIARSLVMDPKVLLMDEPFSALDEQTRMLLHNELQEIWLETGKTIIFVTHNIREAVKLSDRVVVMGIRPGRIIDEISIKEPHPRSSTDSKLYYYEEKIFSNLKNEIEKVAKEELGNEYNFEKSPIPNEHNINMGGGI